MNSFNLDFFNAKNGEKTCRLNGKLFHSAYNPSKEAENFSVSQKITFTPSCIVLLEPALSYCAGFLRKQFPSATLIAVRFLQDFSNTDILWDKVLSFSEDGDFSQTLYSALGEEKLLSSLILDWPGSRNIFPETFQKVWQHIKKAVLTARDVLYTREKFSRRWFLNSAEFFNYGRNFYSLKKTAKDVVVTASGPSLQSSIPLIKQHRASFFLMAVSSSLSVLLSSGIVPDMVVSTDGGFWAEKHLSFNSDTMEKLKNTVFALSDECRCPKSILENHKILPLIYPSSIGEKICSQCRMEGSFPALRNGTVSGTAAALALAISSRKVYFCGLDLAAADGFQHTQPNMLEKNAGSVDFRLNTKEKRQTAARFSSGQSLEIYRRWFKSQGEIFCRRLFRVSESGIFSESLEPVKDISWNEISFDAAPSAVEFEKQDNFNKKDLKKIFLEALNDDSLRKELFPLEAVLLEREKDEDKINDLKIEIQKKKSEIEKKLRRLFDE